MRETAVGCHEFGVGPDSTIAPWLTVVVDGVVGVGGEMRVPAVLSVLEQAVACFEGQGCMTGVNQGQVVCSDG